MAQAILAGLGFLTGCSGATTQAKTAGLAAPAKTAAPAAARKPNIVLILADDLGYGELGVQGSTDIPTPQIDSLARGGIRFTNGYVSCPLCSPTRAGLMTGRYQQRFGHEFNPGPQGADSPTFGLPLSETTLARELKSLGYATGIFGKWHLGNRPEFQPPNRGFDEFFGFLGGAHAYLEPKTRPQAPILHGDQAVTGYGYTTDAFTREAVSFIDRHKSEPFFLYVPYNAVHSPLQATEKYLERFQAIPPGNRRTFAAMLSAMDDGVGAVLKKLRQEGLEENTLIVFLSDNGGPTRQTTSSNKPLRGFKGQMLEGGIRIPFMVQWKGHLPQGKVYDLPVISLDIYPTAVAAAGGSVSKERHLDGVDLLPFLEGSNPAAPHDRLFWRMGKQGAVRQGDWKLVWLNDGTRGLYNLAEDIGESTDLSDRYPDRVKELTGAYDRWNSELAEPLWTPRRAPRRPANRP